MHGLLLPSFDIPANGFLEEYFHQPQGRFASNTSAGFERGLTGNLLQVVPQYEV